MGVSLQTIDGNSCQKPADQTAREKQVCGATCSSQGMTCGYDISHVRLEIFKLNKPFFLSTINLGCFLLKQFFWNHQPWTFFLTCMMAPCEPATMPALFVWGPPEGPVRMIHLACLLFFNRQKAQCERSTLHVF